VAAAKTPSPARLQSNTGQRPPFIISSNMMESAEDE
jgi:hypothetical protein